MSTVDQSGGRPPFVGGALAGVLAWFAGYAVTFLAVGTEVQDSAAQRFIEAVQGEPATYEIVGWVFYNLHLVDTVFVGVPAVGQFTTNAIGGDGGFSPVLYLIPVGLLFAAGLAVARYRGVSSVGEGVVTGATVVPGYLVLTVIGLVLFKVNVGGATARPEQFEAVVLAGLLFPAAFAGSGGALAALTAGE